MGVVSTIGQMEAGERKAKLVCALCRDIAPKQEGAGMSLFAQWFRTCCRLLDNKELHDGSEPYYRAVRYFVAQQIIAGTYQ